MEQNTGFPMGMDDATAYNYARWREDDEWWDDTRGTQGAMADDRTQTLMMLVQLYPNMSLQEAFEKLDDPEFLENALSALSKGEDDEQAD